MAINVEKLFCSDLDETNEWPHQQTMQFMAKDLVQNPNLNSIEASINKIWRGHEFGTAALGPCK
jgi:hypothetical protein